MVDVDVGAGVGVDEDMLGSDMASKCYLFVWSDGDDYVLLRDIMWSTRYTL